MVTTSGVKVDGQGQGKGHGVKSGEGSRLGVQVRGQGLGVKVWGSRSGSRFWDQGRGVKVRVMIGGHKVGVNVRGQGQGSGQGQGEGVKVWQIGVRWSVGEVGDKQSVPFKNS